MFLESVANFEVGRITNYSKHLLDRLLIPADPYTPNVIKNLKDKPQPFRASRIYLNEETAYDRGRGEWIEIISPGPIDTMPRWFGTEGWVHPSYSR